MGEWAAVVRSEKAGEKQGISKMCFVYRATLSLGIHSNPTTRALRQLDDGSLHV